MKKYFRRTWLEISLDAVRSNYTAISGVTSPGAQIMAIVKADAYGHGVEYIVKELTDCGCEWFGVSNLEEAMQVRSVNSDCAVLILGYTPPEYAEMLALNNITQTVFDEEYANSLSEQAVKSGVQITVHIKVDTGMSRLGFVYHDSVENSAAVETIAAVCALPGLYPEGVFTHFTSAGDEGGEAFTRVQYDLFLTLLGELKKSGVEFKIRHCCNSAATLLYPEMHLDLVRPGLILYGLHPSWLTRDTVELTAVLQMKTIVSMVKRISSDTPVSYSGKYVSDGEIKVATVPVGYADGYPRSLSGNTKMLIHGKTVPVLGSICMDQCVIDVTDVANVKAGDTVTVFGFDGDEGITVDSIAARHNTINYEIICGINKRVPRVYKKGGEISAIADYMK